MLRSLPLVLIIIQLRICPSSQRSHHAKRTVLELNGEPPLVVVPPLEVLHPLNIAELKPNTRKKKAPVIPLSLPIPHQLLIPGKLHVIPAHSNMHHTALHTDIKHVVTKDNIKIPIVTQTVLHSFTNITHPAPLVPVLIPVHSNELVPVHDLSVIPLQKMVPKVNHLRAAIERSDGDELIGRRYSNIFGGFGTGLLFGGQGAGHGFYASG